MATFKEEHRELQEIVKEIVLVRNHNLTFKEGDPQGHLLHFAEGLLVLLGFERFLRAILGSDATERDTLPNLLEKATSSRLDLIKLPGRWTREESIKAITSVRNTVMHGNYEQAAAGAGSADVRGYFKSGQYISEIQTLFEILDTLMRQIDATTGRPIRE